MTTPTQLTINAAVQAWFDASIGVVPIANHTDIQNQVFNSLPTLEVALFADVTSDSEATATNTLTLTPGTIADDIIQIGGVYYQWTSAVTTGGDGTSQTTPWQVYKGSTATAGLTNLKNAINGGIAGTPGTDYSAGIVANPLVVAASSSSTTVVVNASGPGVAGNSVSTTVIVVTTADGFAWATATLTGGTGTNWTNMAAAVDNWRDAQRGYPINGSSNCEAQLDSALPALKTSLASLFA